MSGWPTPNSTIVDAKPRPPITRNRKPTDPQISTADIAVHLLGGWPTPSSSGFEAKDLERLKERREECKERTGNGNGFGLTLGQAAPLWLNEAEQGPARLTASGGAADWLLCTDGKWRAVEPGTFPLAHGVSGRVGRLRAYGNAIVPQQAAHFIEAFSEAVGIQSDLITQAA